MNTASLLKLADHLETWKPGIPFHFGFYRNMHKYNTLEYPISIYDLSHDEAEALFVPGIGRTDIKEDGSKMELEMLPCTSTRHEVAARIRKFVAWKEESIMTKTEKAWSKVLNCLDRLANEERAHDYEAKDSAIEAITEYAALVIPKPSPPPNHLTCPKCGNTAHKFYYINDICIARCGRLKCPNHEHMHITCYICQYCRWEHCADHVEAQGGEHES